MSSYIVVTGRLGRDVDVTNSRNNGGRMVRFSLASNTGYKDKQQTTWYNCSSFSEDVIRFLSQWGKRGKAFTITGEHSMRPYQGKDGSQKESNDIRVFSATFAESMYKDEGSGQNGGGYNGNNGGGYQNGYNNNGGYNNGYGQQQYQRQQNYEPPQMGFTDARPAPVSEDDFPLRYTSDDLEMGIAPSSANVGDRVHVEEEVDVPF